MLSLNVNSLPTKPLHTLVENRTTFTLESVALNLFETHERASAVNLRFDNPVLASMIEGRKVMHLGKKPGFNFLPGESVMLPTEELMVIDFPDAKAGRPTKCLALEIDPSEIQRVTDEMNERRPRTCGWHWQREETNFHFANDPGITHLIQRLVFLCAEDHAAKDIFVSMSLRELLIRLLEAESRSLHVADPGKHRESNPITAAVSYILNHLDDHLTVERLSRLACMSASGFHNAFKNEMGVTPVEFVNSERIKLGVSLLRRGNCSVQEVAVRCGFNSASYFTRVFKQRLGVNPTSFLAKSA
ncbi:AraC family transcriptional regulator [Neolewinella aurantiaca]|uniref:AraC family transcriptional regulator n=1 Tax=Neolewinella aurantiaca TaxID=2602767 RepID=A0A5C7F499_9BACT|nr:AraC family transcriptional regulator [Neolewinella aurantiaca]TXF84377.1 AraC family transcriptional regulator [Neolewinella aurantiaca]